MTNEEAKVAFREWLKTRPESVQRIAEKYPPSILIVQNDLAFYVIGYTEDDKLIVSETNPKIDYEKAVAEKQYICVSHLANAVTVREF